MRRAGRAGLRRFPEERCAMNRMKNKLTLFTSVLALGCTLALSSFAGEPMKWEQVPEPVRATVLANGGKAGSVDLEGERISGKAVYEAVGKDKKGKQVDLVITEDGKLVEMKHDGAADQAKEDAIAIRKAQKAFEAVKFSHPRDITNPYLPLASLKQDILEGKEGGKSVRVERTIKPDLRKTFKVGKQKVEALVMEDREFENGELAEVALDYFAQADDGTVYYLGEDVDEYRGGKVAGHSGAWLYGKQAKVPGVIMPAQPKVGDKFRPEDVPPITTEDDEVLAASETVTVPAGNYESCLKVKEVLSDGSVEYKYYAKGVGCVREVPEGGDLQLKSHTTR
jgi:hypothetical protein